MHGDRMTARALRALAAGACALAPLLAAGDVAQDAAFAARRQRNQRSMEALQNAFTPEQLQKALRVTAQTLIRRDPRADEVARLSGGFPAYKAIVEDWLESPAFRDAQLEYYRNYFEMSGVSGGVNFDEPANLATYLVVNDLDFRDVLRADYCVGNDLQRAPCSSFASNAALAATQAAGALTTRAFLVKWEGPFNFRRVDRAFRAFACKTYPDSRDEGMTEAEISDSVKTFSSRTANPACYNCHRSMNPRASLFYSFDRSGNYNPNPSQGQATVRDNGTRSLRSDLLRDGTTPRYHGVAVRTVREYAEKLASTQAFRDCLAQRLTNQMLGRSKDSPTPASLQDVRDDVVANQYRVKSILLQIATHPGFVTR